MFHPFPECPEVVFGRVAARSQAFASTCASGGAPVVIGSAAGPSAEDVIPRARGELLERVSNILAGRAAESGNARIATFDELRHAGVAAMDPLAWPELGPPAGAGESGHHAADASAPPAGAGESGHHAADASRSAAADLRQARMLWTAGQSLLTEQEILVPASAVYLHHRPPAGCVRMPRPGSTGVSAHVSWQAAVRHALLEVLERDLAWRSWYGAGARPLRLQHPPLSPLLSRCLDRLGLVPTVLLLQGPANVGCIVVCLHTAERGEQSFGARCLLLDDDASLCHGIEAAVYEALMVRWSMGTPVAHRAWQDMRRTSPPGSPRGPLEHALWTFHRQDSLGHWLAWAVADDGWTASPATQTDAGADWRRLARLLAEHTGSDVIAVDTTVPAVCSDGVTVIRVVAPGARRLPAAERDGDLPHPFG